MCGRYTLRRIDLAALGLRSMPEPEFEEFSERPRYNIAPSQDVAVVRLNKDDNRVLGLVRWGLIPHWCKQAPNVKPINARAETLATSPIFKEAFGRRRCLVPADGFYEWKNLGAGKQPMFVHYPDDRVFAFAGIWERWKPSPDAEPIDTCAVITTNANRLMAPIHDRMPAIIRPEDYAKWLDRSTDPADAQKLLAPYPDGEMEAVPVDRVVNSPANDLPECVKPLRR